MNVCARQSTHASQCFCEHTALGAGTPMETTVTGVVMRLRLQSAAWGSTVRDTGIRRPSGRLLWWYCGKIRDVTDGRRDASAAKYRERRTTDSGHPTRCRGGEGRRKTNGHRTGRGRPGRFHDSEGHRKERRGRSRRRCGGRQTGRGRLGRRTGRERRRGSEAEHRGPPGWCHGGRWTGSGCLGRRMGRGRQRGSKVVEVEPPGRLRRASSDHAAGKRRASLVDAIWRRCERENGARVRCGIRENLCRAPVLSVHVVDLGSTPNTQSISNQIIRCFTFLTPTLTTCFIQNFV